MDIFVSVGSTATEQQEAFVRAVEDRLRSEGLSPHSVGRNTFSAAAPLKAVSELMNKCAGVVVIAFERTYFPAGTEKRGGKKEAPLSDIRVATPWNQIEAAMAYTLGRPILVIVEEGVRSEGLLEKGNDWYVQWVKLDMTALSTPEFNGVLADWKSRTLNTDVAAKGAAKDAVRNDPEQMTVGQLVSSLKPGQLWGALIVLAAVVSGAFAVGAQLIKLP